MSDKRGNKLYMKDDYDICRSIKKRVGYRIFRIIGGRLKL